MASVFAGTQVHNGGFRADQFSLAFGGVDVAGFMLQQLQFNFQQQIQTMYELGSANVYYIGGRASGTASIGRAIGPAPLTAGFLRQYNDICNPQDIELDASAGCNGNGIGYTLQDAVLNGMSLGTQAQSLVVSENLGFLFANLDSPQI